MRRGFTLVELLIVISVLAVLITGLIVVIDPSTQLQKTNDAKRKSDLAQIQRALETYYQDNRVYPPNPSANDYRIKGLDGNTVDWGSSWQPFMSALPKDPSSSKNYVYYVTSNGQTYYLYASLDRGANDLQACNGGAACASLPANASCGALTICNFGLSSPNVSP